MAFDYLRANAKRVGLDRDLGQYDLNIQVMSPTHGKDTADLGVAFYIAILSAIVNKPIAGSWSSWDRCRSTASWAAWSSLETACV